MNNTVNFFSAILVANFNGILWFGQPKVHAQNGIAYSMMKLEKFIVPKIENWTQTNQIIAKLVPSMFMWVQYLCVCHLLCWFFHIITTTMLRFWAINRLCLLFTFAYVTHRPPTQCVKWCANWHFIAFKLAFSNKCFEKFEYSWIFLE